MMRQRLFRLMLAAMMFWLVGCGGGSNGSDSVSEGGGEPLPDMPGFEPVDESFCEDWEELTSPGFRYSNNVWNKGDVTDYDQCLLRRTVGGDDTRYGWNWRWPYGSGNVKAYPEVIYGRKPWDAFSTTSDLPRQIASIDELRVDYEFELTAQGTYNVAFSMWVTRDNPPTPEGITHEIMIWVDRTFEPQPSEFQIDQVEIDGVTYDLYLNPTFHHGGKYIAFASHADRLVGTLDFEKFLDYLINHGHLPVDGYVTSVELGNEVIEGRGELWLKAYQVTVN